MQSTATFDRTAMLTSIACILHCVTLPLVAVALPFAAAIAEAEWLHWALALIAIAASTMVFISSPSARTWSFLVPAFAGSVLIAGALMAEPLGVDDTLPTLFGGLLLAIAHGRRLFQPRR